jgi:hypothetical protein
MPTEGDAIDTATRMREDEYGQGASSDLHQGTTAVGAFPSSWVLFAAGAVLVSLLMLIVLMAPEGLEKRSHEGREADVHWYEAED